MKNKETVHTQVYLVYRVRFDDPGMPVLEIDASSDGMERPGIRNEWLPA
jgi:hypothetical protein